MLSTREVLLTSPVFFSFPFGCIYLVAAHFVSLSVCIVEATNLDIVLFVWFHIFPKIRGMCVWVLDGDVCDGLGDVG